MVYSQFSGPASETHAGFGDAGNKYRHAQTVCANDTYMPSVVQDYLDCSRDPVHFLRNHTKVFHPTEGLIPFDPYPHQEHLIHTFNSNRRVFALTARQMGKTTCAAGFLLWKAMFTPDTSIVIVCHNMKTSHDVMGRVRQMYETTPEFLRPDLLVDNRNSIKFANGSRITATSVGSTHLRGQTVSLLYLDEMAFVDDATFSDVWASFIPCLASTEGSCIITTSAGDSGSEVHQLWSRAMMGEVDICPIRIPWEQHPKRDKDWADRTKSYLGEDMFKREYCCVFG